MTEETLLDVAHLEAEADESRRPRFMERLAEAELFVLLEKEPEADQISPQLFALEEATFVLAFDRATRLTDFTGQAAPYASLSGRQLAQMLASEGLGLGLNLDVAPSSQLLPPAAIGWLADILDSQPAETEAKPSQIAPPTNLPETLIHTLDSKLALTAGLAEAAYLAEVTYDNSVQTHLLAFIEALPEAQPSLASAVQEALTFSGLEAGSLDVAFLQAADPICASLARNGLRFDLPEAEQNTVAEINVGLDPAKPPKLR